MARKPRICRENTTYHVVSRCIEKKHLMQAAKMKHLMLSILNMALEKYSFELIGYTLMDNHFHFFIKTVSGGASISRIMQFVKSQYAQRYNKRLNRIGPFWNERFSDTIVELSGNPIFVFFWILFYIAYNPVRSGQVKDPKVYEFSSINCYYDKNYNSPVKITLHEYFLNLGDTFNQRVEKLLEYENMFRKRIFPISVFA